ncbi:hypothetical protein [Ralstonia sp. 24A2]|uniref:hypothetical protein n=1 Tax=Ralstonia sp. 24A2 TaxID=3447364 RepID=UPI003F69F33C
MNTAFSRRILLAAVAAVSASAALLSASPAVAGQVKEPYTNGQAAAKADPYTDGAAAKFDPYTQGADRQADTYGYLSWKGDRFDPYTQGAVGKADPYTDGAIAKADPYTDGAAAKFDPYTQGADRQADTYGYLSWNGDTSYPKDAASNA